MPITIGQTLGNYRVARKLGSGGMGSVYLAEHPLIGKKVALKVIHRELSRNQEVVTRFFNEARIVNQIGSEHIVDISDFGQTPEGDHFFVMEHLDGISLADVLRQEHTVPAPRALKIAAQIAQALGAAHDGGIVHRDLKPDNVFLVEKMGEKDFVKLLDFGLAKLLDPGNPALTRAGVVLGTPQYMSPEQAESKATIDHRSDIYALGVLLYHMTTGVLPFDGRQMGEILVKHVSDPVPPLRGVNPQVPPAVEQLVLRCLAKKPEGRFQSMTELRKALLDPDAWLRGDKTEPVERVRSRLAEPAPMKEGTLELSASQAQGKRRRIREEPRRGRGLAVAVFFGLAALLSVAGVFLVRTFAHPSAPAPATAPASEPVAAPPPPPPPPPKVEPLAPPPVPVKVTSAPAGARVLDESGADLGTTPLTLTVEHGQPRAIVLKLAGYQERREVLAADAGDVSVALEKVKPARPRPPRPPKGDDEVMEPRL